MKIIDLSMPLDNRTPTYPGDPQIQIEQLANLTTDGWNEKRIQCNTHCGTHIDAPVHFIEQGKTIDQLPLTQFQGQGVVIDVRKTQITLNQIKDKNITKDSIVLFLTGQSDKRYTNYYDNAKFIPENVAHELIKKKIKAIGIDSFSPDQSPYPIHKLLLPKNILIIENLINLNQLLNKTFTIQYFPLLITQGDGAPCRAIAITK